MEGKVNYDIRHFSSHLFWDLNHDAILSFRNKKLLVSRVLEYGLMKDWKLLCELFQINEIGEIAKELRSLDERALAFISLLSDIPTQDFRCSITKQSIPKH